MKEKLNEQTKEALTRMIADGIITRETAGKYFPELREIDGEKIRKTLMSYLIRQKECASQKTFLGIPIEQIIAWLGNQGEQKSKVAQKTTWSEEDEVGFGDALWAIEQARTIAKDENDMGNLWYAERWLKSIKDRYAWKPSEEQIEAIRLARSFVTDDFSVHHTLSELLLELEEQLKKIKEEWL